ncbi:MAG TPA: helix-hairpin-helix domain-containing protein [Acidobacteriaceae bacterium]|nr:helix-hairpin-helix domain-containing protein [Acidobacteriaceae bacterium]
MALPARLLCAIAVAALAISTPRTASVLHAQPQVAPGAAIGEPLDINTASLDQLLRLPGLTRTWAARIIRFRPYRGKNELLDRGVLPAGVYARIKDRIIAHRSRN